MEQKKLIKTAVLVLLSLSLVQQARAASFTVNDFSDTADANTAVSDCADSAGKCTLRAAIQQANANGGSNTISLPAGTYSLSLTSDTDTAPSHATEVDAASGDLDISNNLTITGAGASTTIVDGFSLYNCTTLMRNRVFQIVSGYTVTISGLTVQYAGADQDSAGNSALCDDGSGGGATQSTYSPDEGGGIYNSGTLTLSSVIVSHNEADDEGGGIYNDGALALSSVTVDSNRASDSGGGILSEGSTFSMENSSVTLNVATSNGAGIALSGADGEYSQTATISSSTINQNFAMLGAGMVVFNTRTTIDETTISQNMSLAASGIFYYYPDLTIQNSTITGNTAFDYSFTTSLGTSSGSSLETDCDNGADDDGDGDIDTADSNCTIGLNGGEKGSVCFDGVDNDSDTFVDNRDIDCWMGTGGALMEMSVPTSDSIYYMGGTVNINNSTISGNQTHRGGAAIVSHSATVNINNATIYDNHSAQSLTMTSGEDSIVLTALDDNSIGGGVINTAATVSNGPSAGTIGSITLRNTILAGNTAVTSSPDCHGAITSGDYNIIGDQSGCTLTAGSNDQVGDSSAGIAVVDPLIDALALNGGATENHALQATSTAIDRGNPAGCMDASSVLFDEDQRGEARHQDAIASDAACNQRCDIGAYEAAGTDTTCVEICDNGADDDIDGDVDCDDSECEDDPACAEDCDNGIDDDDDTDIDCDDSECATDPYCIVPDEDCDNGADDDGDGMIDCDDPECASDPSCAETPVEACVGGLDEDLDGDIDCDDSDCASDASCTTSEGSSSTGCLTSGGKEMDVSELGLDAQDAIKLANGATITKTMDGVDYTITPIGSEKGFINISVMSGDDTVTTASTTACVTTAEDKFKLSAAGNGCSCNMGSSRPSARHFFIQAILTLLVFAGFWSIRRNCRRN